MIHTHQFAAVVSLLFLAAGFSLAEEPPENSELVVSETFSEKELSTAWHKNTGDWSIVDGVLRVKEIAADKHSAAARRAVVTKDAVYQLQFRFVNEGKIFHFGFDPAKGELKKRGHLFSIIITPAAWSIMKHVDKDRPKEAPNEVLARQATKFETGEWYTLRVTTSGKHVTAVIEGKEALKASHETFAVKKPTLVFRCIGDGVEIDDIKVWSQQQ